MGNSNNKSNLVRGRLGAGLLLMISFLIGACGTSSPSPASPAPATVTSPIPVSLQSPSELFSLCWVAYSPTHYDPEKGIDPSEQSLREDLQVLHEAGFNGLVTYSSSGALGSLVPGLVQEMGFQGLIMGVWDPTSRPELDQAIAAAKYATTVGYVVGNEGLDQRYDLSKLQSAMDELRRATNKPVATTEEIGDYGNTALLDLGDWVFPNAHPFWAGILDPGEAAAWTERVYTDLRSRTDKPILFKEVGMPTGGDPRGRLNESIQAEYYRRLRDTTVQFVYFESFDQPWKDDPSVEPFWGLFRADRTPKEAAQYTCGHAPAAQVVSTLTSAPELPVEATPTDTPMASLPPTEVGPSEVFNVYTDADASDNHFIPSGYMGDTGDILMNEVWTDNPHSGSSAIKITYTTEGKGPSACPFQPPCKWAGVYWLNPANNWGEIPNAGFDLRGYRRLTFWARSDNRAVVEFKVGGVSSGAYPSSIRIPMTSGLLTLPTSWRQYEILLEGADLSYVIDGFVWTTNWGNNGANASNPKTLVFYLDDIRFER